MDREQPRSTQPAARVSGELVPPGLRAAFPGRPVRVGVRRDVTRAIPQSKERR